MSTQEASQNTVLPSTYGTAFIIDCSGCGRTFDFPARERDRFERMTEFHENFCDGRVETEMPGSGPNA